MKVVTWFFLIPMILFADDSAERIKKQAQMKSPPTNANPKNGVTATCTTKGGLVTREGDPNFEACLSGIDRGGQMGQTPNSPNPIPTGSTPGVEFFKVPPP